MDNVVADALSRQGEKGELDVYQAFEEILCEHSDISLFCLDYQADSHSSLFLISFPHPTQLKELKSSYLTHAEVQEILQTLHNNPDATGKFNLQNGLLLYKGQIFWALLVV